MNPYEADPTRTNSTVPRTVRPRTRFITLVLFSLLLALNFAALFGTYNLGGQGAELINAIGWLQLVSPFVCVGVWASALRFTQSNVFDVACMLLALGANGMLTQYSSR